MSAPAEDPVALLLALYLAFNERDIDRALAGMAPDVAWPNGWEGGHVHGHEGVRDYWTRQWAAIDPHVEPVEVAVEPDGRVAVLVDQVVRDLCGAVVAEGRVVHAYRLSGGLVTEMEIRETPG
jgi:ketosteroid isomerase-like protein